MNKGEIARNKILKVAISEFGSLGLHHATLDKIAKKAKVQKPLIIYYFKNKNGLLIAAIEKVMENFDEILRSFQNNDNNGLVQIHQILASNLLLTKLHPDSTRLIVMLYTNATWDKEFKALAKLVSLGARNRYAGILKSALREGYLKKDSSCDSIAKSIHFWIIGAMIDLLQGEVTPREEGLIKKDWEILINGWISST